MRQPSPIYGFWRVATKPGGGYLTRPEPQSVYSIAGSYSFAGSRSGQSCPDWKRKLASMQTATTPYSATYYELLRWDDLYMFRVDGWTAMQSGRPINWWGFQQATSSSLNLKPSFQFLGATFQERTDLMNRTASALISKEARARVYADALVTMGEFGETLSILRSPLRRVPRLIDRYLRKVERKMKLAKKKGRYITIDELNGLYLGWYLAIAPLIGEIESYAEAIASAELKERLTEVQCTLAMAPRAATSVTSGTASGKPFTRVNVDKLEMSIRAKSGIRISLDSDASSRFLKAVNLDGREILSRWAPSAWELLPFSFVLDYFGNFAEVIESRYSTRADVAWTSMMVREIATSSRALNVGEFSLSTPTGAIELISSESVPGIGRYEVVRRKYQRYTDIPKVDFFFQLPTSTQATIVASLTLALSGLAKKADKMLKRHFS